MDLTAETIAKRSKRYRKLVVSVVAIALVLLAWTAITRAVQPLVGLIAVVPLCSLFFAMDSKLLHDWARHLLEAWTRDEVDLVAFSQTISSNTTLPGATLEGMVAMLPRSDVH